MKPSVRIRICSGCGHVLVRSTVRAKHRVFEVNPLSQQFRWYMAWRSFFRRLGLGGPEPPKPLESPNSTESQRPTESRDVNKSKERPARKVRQLREAKEQFRRQAPRQRPSDVLKSVMHRDSPSEPLLSPDFKVTPSGNALSKPSAGDISRLLLQQQQRMQSQRKLLKLVTSQKDVSETIFTPHRDPTAERRDPLKKYFERLPQEKPVLPHKTPFPWEEEPLKDDEKMKILQDLLKLIPHQSTLINPTQPTPRGTTDQTNHSSFLDDNSIHYHYSKMADSNSNNPITHRANRFLSDPPHTSKLPPTTSKSVHDQTIVGDDSIDSESIPHQIPIQDPINPLEDNNLDSGEYILNACGLRKSLKSSQLYRHLREHHDSVYVHANNDTIPPFKIILALAKSRLKRIQDEIPGAKRDLTIFSELASNLTLKQPRTTSQVLVTPLIRYILLSQGFGANRVTVTTPLEQLVGDGDLDSLGRLKSYYLHSMVLHGKTSPLSNYSTLGYSDLAKRTFGFDLFKGLDAADVTPPFSTPQTVYINEFRKYV